MMGSYQFRASGGVQHEAHRSSSSESGPWTPAPSPRPTLPILILSIAYGYFLALQKLTKSSETEYQNTYYHSLLPLSLSFSLFHPKLRKPFKLFMAFQIKTWSFSPNKCFLLARILFKIKVP